MPTLLSSPAIIRIIIRELIFMKRKFVTEYALGFLNSYTCWVTAHGLLNDNEINQEKAEELSNCHIYAITAIPTVYFEENSIKYKDSMLSGFIYYKVNGVKKKIEFKDVPFKLTEQAISIDCKYPHKEIVSYDVDGNECRYIPAYYIAMLLNQENKCPELNNYEVLYIGQAIGNKANRTAIDRLKSHSTLQKILARTSHEFPDKEITIFMYEFKHENMFTSIDGRATEAINTNENEKRLFNAIKNLPDKKQKISLIEACLIRYFQPYYNTIFKIKFPSIKAKILSSCYNLDISGLVVEINCEDLNYRLYSPSVKSKYHHIAKVDLFHSKDRDSFFSARSLGERPDIIR